MSLNNMQARKSHIDCETDVIYEMPSGPRHQDVISQLLDVTLVVCRTVCPGFGALVVLTLITMANWMTTKCWNGLKKRYFQSWNWKTENVWYWSTVHYIIASYYDYKRVPKNIGTRHKLWIIRWVSEGGRRVDEWQIVGWEEFPNNQLFIEVKHIAPALLFCLQKLVNHYSENNFQIQILSLFVPHPELNPTELVWGTVKNAITLVNSPFLLNDMEWLSKQEFSQMFSEVFRHDVTHSLKPSQDICLKYLYYTQILIKSQLAPYGQQQRLLRDYLFMMKRFQTYLTVFCSRWYVNFWYFWMFLKNVYFLWSL